MKEKAPNSTSAFLPILCSGAILTQNLECFGLFQGFRAAKMEKYAHPPLL